MPVMQTLLAHPLAFNVVVLLASIFIMLSAGTYFVDALTSYAKKFGLSQYFIGMVVVAVATSSPDIATSIIGLLSGKPEIMSGVVLGGLVLDLAFLNGWFALLSKRIKLETAVIQGSEFIVLGLLLLPFVLMLDGEITRSEGLAMVLSFIIYVMMMWQHEKRSNKLKKWIPVKIIWQDMLVFLLALTSMMLAAKYAVFSVVNLSSAFNISDYLLSITILAFAAALPDMFAGTMSILEGKGGEIGFGESIGSTMIEVNLFTGIVAIVSPIKMGFLSTLIGTLALIGSATYFLIILRKGEIKRSQAWVFLAIYAIYLTLEIYRVTVLGGV